MNVVSGNVQVPAELLRRDNRGGVDATTRAYIDVDGTVSARSEYAATTPFGLRWAATRIVALDHDGEEVWSCQGLAKEIAGTWDPRGPFRADAVLFVRIPESVLDAVSYLAIVHGDGCEVNASLNFAAREAAVMVAPAGSAARNTRCVEQRQRAASA